MWKISILYLPFGRPLPVAIEGMSLRANPQQAPRAVSCWNGQEAFLRMSTGKLLVLCVVVVALSGVATTNAVRTDPTEDTELDMLLSQADAAQKGDFTWDHPKEKYNHTTQSAGIKVSYDAYLKKAQHNAHHKREIEKLHALHKEQNVIPVTFDIFSKYDADHDGDLNYKEFMNMVEFINAGGLGSKCAYAYAYFCGYSIPVPVLLGRCIVQRKKTVAD